MSLLSHLEERIDEDILKEYKLYSTDSMSKNQLDWARNRYYDALWVVLKREYDNE